MSDPVNMSLADIIKANKGNKSPRQGGSVRGARAGPSRGGRNNNRGGAGSYGRRGGQGQNSFRGRKRQAAVNVQGRRGTRGFGGTGRGRQQFSRGGPNLSRGGNVQRFVGTPGQGRGRRLNIQNRTRNNNRQLRRQLNSAGGANQGLSRQGTSNPRYFTQRVVVGEGAKINRNQARRLRLNKGGIPGQQLPRIVPNKNTKRLKLAKKRVQRALLVSRRKPAVGVQSKKLVTASGRVALVNSGFITVRNTKAKRMERALVQMKIARAQQARNRTSPQRTVNLPGTSAMGNRAMRPNRPTSSVSPSRARSMDWNTPIIRTMRNDLADEMTSGQLNPDIQRKIAFIQSRSRGERAPVMPDFKAPVTTSRMKLSDRFRLLRDQ